MNRYLKAFLIAACILLALVLIGIGGTYWSMQRRQKQAEKDGERFSAECDTVRIITEQPNIRFSGFNRKELSALRFRLLRGGTFCQDTMLRPSFDDQKGNDISYSLQVPYRSFLKQDTIVLTTANGLHYFISGYHHYAYLHYGMFGYLGSHDCRFSDDCVINNSSSSGGVIVRNEGWVHPERSRLVRRFRATTAEFDSIANQSAINYAAAHQIFEQHRANRQLYSLLTFRIETGPEGVFYIFGEERETRNRALEVLKIDAQTGECRRLRNYPFDEQ
ncbi:hypothetical protein [Niabella beijingensis]|uniref:hypothetical protein n=1 Tax=Niabella beijingensis TaxID=2872700 RepID=UPI001CC0EAD1|nr:hypothetical protein [Niabella beijingensis]MBZ4190457.1 hypothetical protein [Niabella beijingensis]